MVGGNKVGSAWGLHLFLPVVVYVRHYPLGEQQLDGQFCWLQEFYWNIIIIYLQFLKISNIAISQRQTKNTKKWLIYSQKLTKFYKPKYLLKKKLKKINKNLHKKQQNSHKT